MSNLKYFKINVNNINLLIKHNNYVITNISLYNEKLINDATLESNLVYINDVKKEFDNYFNKENYQLNLKYKLIGTKFQIAVWNELLKIPYGKVLTYSDISNNINKPKSFRAVGNAIGKNPLLILVPCHRVIKKDGSLGGFSAGINIKEMLHETENIKL